MSNTTHPETATQRNGLVEYVEILARWKNMVFFNALIIAVLTAAYLWFFVPNEFESHATLRASTMVQVNSSGLGSLLGMKGVGDVSGMLGLGSQRSDLEQYVAVLSSDAVIGEIVRRFHLKTEYDVRFEEDAVKMYREQTKFAFEREGQLLTIAVRDTSPARAQQMCVSLISLLDSVNRALARRNAEGAREYLELRYRRCVNDLGSAEDSLRIFQIRNKVFDMKDQATASIKVAAELEGQILLKDVQANILGKSLGQDDADTRRLVEEAAALRQKRRQLDSGLNATGAFQSIVPFASAPQVGMEYFRRYRDVEIQQKLFALLYPMVEQARVEEQRTTPTVLVLDSPTLPQRKSKPKRSIITIVVFLIAALFSYAAALGIENIRRLERTNAARYDRLARTTRSLLPRFLRRKE